MNAWIIISIISNSGGTKIEQIGVQNYADNATAKRICDKLTRRFSEQFEVVAVVIPNIILKVD